MRPVSQQVIAVTGATDGLGRYVAEQLVAAGATVVVHGRNPTKVERVRSELARAPGRVETVVADLADLRQVDRLAGELLQRLDRLDVLVNNAGVGFGPPGSGRELSADQIELRFAVNYLAGYRLTRRLLPLLRASAPARVVNVASAGQEPIDVDDPMLERRYDGVTAYRRSKLAQIMFTLDLAEELRDQGVTVNALHPATFMDTPMVREFGGEPRSTIEEGGAATLRLITDPELDGVTGTYFDGMRETTAHRQAYDSGARARLRALSDELVARSLPASA
ncbi:SDR family NAD(P)-dependent oxidoreductase [Actinopolymorpha alba]|uniref:SDR family NAD(P)-dependent oxidoreductase n=1 Tax=Actinopolymorpha alba TaxID=533267 RepID=UPI000368BE27|nr:SDR family NAD(P)-dependent oxidoreductase [Actinopolymorpha alba]